MKILLALLAPLTLSAVSITNGAASFLYGSVIGADGSTIGWDVPEYANGGYQTDILTGLLAPYKLPETGSFNDFSGGYLTAASYRGPDPSPPIIAGSYDTFSYVPLNLAWIGFQYNSHLEFNNLTGDVTYHVPFDATVTFGDLAYTGSGTADMEFIQNDSGNYLVDGKYTFCNPAPEPGTGVYLGGVLLLYGAIWGIRRTR